MLRLIRSVLSQMPFPEAAGAVAGLLEHLGNRDFIDPQRIAAESRVVQTGAKAIATGHQPGSGRCTDRRSVEASEVHAFSRKPVHHRRIDVFVATHAKVPPALIVRENEQNVGLLGSETFTGNQNNQQRDAGKGTNHGFCHSLTFGLSSRQDDSQSDFPGLSARLCRRALVSTLINISIYRPIGRLV